MRPPARSPSPPAPSSVVTIEFDPAFAASAADHLAIAGYPQVTVIAGDGALENLRAEIGATVLPSMAPAAGTPLNTVAR